MKGFYTVSVDSAKIPLRFFFLVILQSLKIEFGEGHNECYHVRYHSGKEFMKGGYMQSADWEML